MDYREIIAHINHVTKAGIDSVAAAYPDEVYLEVDREFLLPVCRELHKLLRSAIMMFFAVDARKETNDFELYCVFLSAEIRKWLIIKTRIPADAPHFASLAKEIYSATLFERQIREMFGIEPQGSPDSRRLHLHDEVWPPGSFPLRKDFIRPAEVSPDKLSEYAFTRVEGEGIFEVPVGPVHAGIIGPGHFRFSVAGEPVINLEVRLGFTHRGVEKIFEGRNAFAALQLAECICGDTAFGYSLAFCRAVEKIYGMNIPRQAILLRAMFLELERMYNHAADIGGIALDVGFSFAAMYAQAIKEALLCVNEKLGGSRYLKGINTAGGVTRCPGRDRMQEAADALGSLERDFRELLRILKGSVSFMDRVDSTGVLRKKTAEDFGVKGLAGRASGIGLDLRKVFPGIYQELEFNLRKREKGDVLARLEMRFDEFTDSLRMVRQCLQKSRPGEPLCADQPKAKAGFGLGYAEAWRGPVFFWLKLNEAGVIERCKPQDPSFQNWPALSYAVLGNIIPDFPLCNKSFDLSYSGNDL